MELFEKLGIDWRMLIAQLVNFAILFGALTFLLYKPLLKTLDTRRKKIADSLENAEQIGEELKRANAEAEKIVAYARAEAGRLASETAKQAEEARMAAVDKARVEVAGIIAGGKAALAAERDAMTASVRAAAAEMISQATEKIIGEKLNAVKDKHLIEKALQAE